jgi:lysophospholipase L1-like esterase
VRSLLIAVIILFAVIGAAFYRRQSTGSATSWEPAIRKFEESDRAAPPKPGEIVFAGSSSIRFWDTLADDMKPLDVLNRGFGGSQIADVNHFAPRIVIPYRPRAVVLYCGDNDLAASKSPETVFGDFKEFVQIIHGALPDTWIYFISIKPSTLRWSIWPKMQQANRMIEEFARTQQRVQFIDVSSAMLDSTGNPKRDLLKPDGLHPTPKCYQLWTSIIKPVLMQRFGPEAGAVLAGASAGGSSQN